MRSLAIATIALTGCSAIFMEKPPLVRPKGRPVYCTANKGLVAWDGLMSGLHVVNAALMFSVAGKIASEPTSTSTSDKSPFVIGGVASAGFFIGHLISAVKGARWANECREARAEYDATLPPIEPVKPVVVPAVVEPELPPPPMKVEKGTKPLYCAGTECWRQEAACTEALAATTASACEVHREGACFTGSDKREVCAVSIEECEARRASAPEGKDSRCSVYEVMKGW